MTADKREVVLITGTRKGIGEALVEHFVAKGSVVEGCSRELPDWELDGYRHHQVNVLDEAQVRGMVQSISDRHGRLDVLVNNAGIASMNHSLLMPVATVDRILETNVTGVFLVSRQAARLMKRNNYGRIVNIGSVAAQLRIEGEAMYAASKTAMLTFTRSSLARLHRSASPAMSSPRPRSRPTSSGRSRRTRSTVSSTRSPSSDSERSTTSANAVDFFASPKSDYITGQVLYLGGA